MSMRRARSLFCAAILMLLPVASFGQADVTADASSETPYETMISKLGSRFMLNFQPQRKTCMESALGKFHDRPRDFILGIETGGRLYALPFSHDVQYLDSVTQTITPTSLEYRAILPDGNARVSFRLTAPFYPQNTEISTAPFFYIDVSLTNLSNSKIDGSVKLLMADLKGEKIRTIKLRSALGMERVWTGKGNPWSECLVGRSSDDTVGVVGAHIGGSKSGSGDFSGIQWNCSVAPGYSISRNAVLAAYVSGDVLDVKGAGYHFIYADKFHSADDVAEWAFAENESIRRKNSVFESTVMDSSIGTEAKNLVSFGFQNWISNTWWVSRSQPSHSFPDSWFSIWEGNCRYHSTVDVVYNDGLILFQYWPELMRMQLNQWSIFSHPGWIPHDIGQGRTVSGQKYPHDMEVEEACNFILLLYQYWKQTADRTAIRAHMGSVRDLVDALARSDTDGNGLPDIGTSNTVDQGSHGIQHAGNQVYLGIKALAAYYAAEQIAASRGDELFALKCRQHVRLVSDSLGTKAWKGDHFAVYLSDKPEPTQDAYSIYTANGLLYLLKSGATLPVDIGRIRQDLIASTAKTNQKYGCTHTSIDANMWISQNLWRDMIALYLSVDMRSEAEKYWRYEVQLNQTQGGCFADSYTYPYNFSDRWPWNTLNYYPRGATAVGLIDASGGVTVDATSRSIGISPVCAGVTIPLASLADWRNEVVPIAHVSDSGQLSIQNQGVLAGWKIDLKMPK